MKFLHAILALLLLTIPSHAKVLIYKGTFKIVSSAPPATTFPAVLSFYLILDPDMNEYADVAYYTKAGKHQLMDAPKAVYFTSADAPGGKTKTAVVLGSAMFTSATNFGANLFLFSGINVTLQFTTMGVAQTVNFPKTLTGPDLIVSNNSGVGSILQTQLAVSFQSKETLTANDAAKTIDEVTADLSTDLQNKDYLP